MKWRDRLIIFICAVIALAAVITAGMQLDFINSKRKEMKLISNEPLQNAPPSLAFATVAMGAFRGLVVDVLWLRADKLKQDGQFFDAKQLAEWITTLQPRFASVWEFQAWNMAYNISAAIPASQPDQRWQWVKNGYELLRDKGIPLNPKSIILYRELARIFQHKIGAFSDDDQEYYKLQLATAIEPLLGNGDENYFKSLVKSPVSFSKLAEDEKVSAFLNVLKAADKIFNDESNFVSNYLSLRQNPAAFNQQCFKVIEAYRDTEELKRVDIFAKAYQLRNVWKLEPDIMMELNNKYGPVDFKNPDKHLPLDWRHPDAHAIYWAVKGVQMLDTKGRTDYSLDEANTDRAINHSLQNLFRYGKIFIYNSNVRNSEKDNQKQSGTLKKIYLRPDLAMFESYNESTKSITEKYKKTRSATYDSMQIGYRNMLTNAVSAFYQAGHVEYAQKIYDELKKQDTERQYKEPLVIFVRERLRDELKVMNFTDVREMVQLLLQESYFRYAMRDDDDAFAREKMAKEIYDTYQSMFLDQDRINLPDIKIMRYFAMLEFLNDQQYPIDLRKALVSRIHVERPELSKLLEEQENSLEKQLNKNNKQK